MDIEKDSNREAFESWFESRYDAHFMQFALDLDMYVDKHTQTCWEAWQAAKAQAVPKGFVLVPKEPTQEMIQAGLEKVRESWDDAPPDGFNSFTWGDMVATWEAMIEAQEPAND